MEVRMAKRQSFLKSLCFAGILLFVIPSNTVSADDLHQGMNTGIGGFSQVLDYYYSSLQEQTKITCDNIISIFAQEETVQALIDTTIGKNIGEQEYTGEDIVEYACRFIGNPYVWGGTSLTSGADCSGFVQSVYKYFGISLERVSKEQAKTAGEKVEVSLATLQPGDLLFYAKASTVNHVAIYIGDGKIVHAAGRKYGITISDYDYRKAYRARRVISNP
jgi:cell wall-associated NlpC family hydrolase